MTTYDLDKLHRAFEAASIAVRIEPFVNAGEHRP